MKFSKGLLNILLILHHFTFTTTLGADESFVGSSSCVACHAKESAEWQGSHHQQAMAEASPETVLGNFNDALFSYNGLTSKFYRRGEEFFVLTDGPDGKLSEYKIAYTFGVYPLQQYMVKFPNGRVQVLSIAWDTRNKTDGGQRWFHLYPDQKVDHSDVLHWTKLSQNWNFMCAECHSTDFQKNYSPKEKTFNSTWSEISVGCEACHGPASQHLEWAKQEKSAQKTLPNGILKSFERTPFIPQYDPKTQKTLPDLKRAKSEEVEACGRCHSRRSVVSEKYEYGKPLAASHFPSLLTDGLYHADGQIYDEVFTYGSFKQSKMYHSGVACSDCHNPHSQKLKLPGNAVCSQCHIPAKYDTTAHHFHKPGTAGAECKSCHMAEKKYMVVDPRFDHSMRIPNPAQSAKIDAPDACTSCHEGKSSAWATKELETRFGPRREDFHDFGETLFKARQNDITALPGLLALLTEESKPAIVRATAATEMSRFLNQQTVGVVARELFDESPVVRAAALGTLEPIPDGIKLQLIPRLLEDDVLSVRIEAARVLASISREKFSAPQLALLDKGSAEYVSSQMANIESPQANLNLGIFYEKKKEVKKAEQYYRNAIALEPQFVPAYVNLSDLFREIGRDQDGLEELKLATKRVPDSAAVHYALGLLQVRLGEKEDALHALKRAATLEPENFQFTYVYAVALKDLGQKKEARKVLESLQTRFPNATSLASLEQALR